MKSTLDQLSEKEKQTLALFYDTEFFKVIRKLSELEIDGLARDALSATDIENVHYLRGRASWAADLPKLVRYIYKESNKKS